MKDPRVVCITITDEQRATLLIALRTYASGATRGSSSGSQAADLAHQFQNAWDRKKPCQKSGK